MGEQRRKKRYRRRKGIGTKSKLSSVTSALLEMTPMGDRGGAEIEWGGR